MANDTERRSRWVQLRVTAEEHATISHRAAMVGMNISDYCRRRALNDPSEITSLREKVERMSEDLASFVEFFKGRRESTPPIPQPETVLPLED